MDTNTTFNIDKRDDCIQHYIYFDCSFCSLSRLSGRFNLVLYIMRPASVPPIDAWKKNWPASTKVRRSARRVPRSDARGKKMYAGDGSTRADKKAGKKYFGGSEKKTRERKKNHFSGSEKKFWRQREHNTQKKNYVQ